MHVLHATNAGHSRADAPNVASRAGQNGQSSFYGFYRVAQDVVLRALAARPGRPPAVLHIPRPSMERALAAKQLAESRRHRITSSEVYAALDPKR
jgi:hypothetical protein